jgi:hypothetical protein
MDTATSANTFVVFPKKGSSTPIYVPAGRSSFSKKDLQRVRSVVKKAVTQTYASPATGVSSNAAQSKSAESQHQSEAGTNTDMSDVEEKGNTHVEDESDCELSVYFAKDDATVAENEAPTGNLQSPKVKEDESRAKNESSKAKKTTPVVKYFAAEKRTGYWHKNPAASFIPGREGKPGRPGIDYSKCNICNSAFEHTGGYEKLRYQWLKHQAKNHPETAPFTCKLCSKPCTTSLILKTHMQLFHKQGARDRMICDYCGKSFHRMHIKTHTQIHLGKKDHICKVCGKAFLRSAQLMSHMKTHTQIKEHICDICGMAFAWAGNMRTHRRRHEKAGFTPPHLSDRAKLETTSDTYKS